MPEVIPAAGAETKPKRVRTSWTQGKLAELVSRFTQGGEIDESERAKLIELGLVEKPAKPGLDDDFRDAIDAFVKVAVIDGMQSSPLAIRYAIKQLQALLPKRGGKE